MFKVGDKVRVVDLVGVPDDVDDYELFVGVVGTISTICNNSSFPIVVAFKDEIDGKTTLGFKVEELQLLQRVSTLMETE